MTPGPDMLLIASRSAAQGRAAGFASLAGIQAGSMVGGTVLIETVFAWPGIGRLMFDALVQRDYNLLLGTFLITAALAVAFNIVTDLLYTLADPRIELQ
ncbi:MAG: ABC transporter permease subunit, partial [Starkeya sp.]|nr:ABC transporter permease subunit [Starkeya sp.]